MPADFLIRSTIQDLRHEFLRRTFMTRRPRRNSDSPVLSECLEWSISRRRSVLLGPGRFGRMRRSRSRRWSSFRPCGRAIRRSGRRGHRVGGRWRCPVRVRRHGEGVEPETGDGGCGLVASHPVKNVARVARGAADLLGYPSRGDCGLPGRCSGARPSESPYSASIRAKRVARMCPVAAVAAVFGNLQSAATGLESATGSAWVRRRRRRVARMRAPTDCGWPRRLRSARRGCDRLLIRPGGGQGDDEASC